MPGQGAGHAGDLLFETGADPLPLGLYGRLRLKADGLSVYHLLQRRGDVQRYEEERLTGEDAAVIGMVAKKRGCVMRGGVPDYDKASAVLLTDFRNGRLGRLTLEMPETAGK